MPKQNVARYAFNRGIISRLALARVDLEKRVALSAEIQNNWMPRTLGSMMLRPGWRYTGGTLNNSPAIHVPFVFAFDDKAIIELTDRKMRVKLDEAVVTRPSVASQVTNGTFGTSVAGWTDADESSTASDWATGGYMSLLGNGENAAIRRQQVTVGAADQNKEHALRIVIERGPVMLRVGSTSGDDDYVSEAALETGVHSLSFTPTGNFHITFFSRLNRTVLVDTCLVESAVDLELDTPWVEADLSLIRWDQSGDVVFVGCDGYQPRRIERRATRSWSVVLYKPEDGPFRAINTSLTTISSNALNGNGTLTASGDVFRDGHVGGLFKLSPRGQTVADNNIASANTFTNAIRVTGVGGSRSFSVLISGTFVATVTLQRSIGEEGNWEDVANYTTTTGTVYSDGLDNQIVFYRIGVKTGNYTSGAVQAGLDYGLGTITGIVRITAVNSGTSADMEVLQDIGNTSATADWYEGEWSDYRGWPTADVLGEGRLWWVGRDKWVGSVSDAFDSFDDEVEGDSGPISRSIGSGPVDKMHWLLNLQRLVAGAAGAEHVARSSTFDEPLTPTNFNLKQPSTQGSAPVPAVKIDTRGVFVQRSGKRVYLLEFDNGTMDYFSSDLTAICPDIGAAGFVRLAVQRQPDTRVHCVRGDGTVAVLIFDPAEDVKGWVTVETDGDVEDAFTLPDDEEDAVYYLVKRTINGQTKRYLERWALESECVGGTLNKQADSFILYSGASTTTISGLAHLEGEEVVVWGNGADLGTYTVTGGQITGLSSSVTSAIVGLGYTARYKSTKLAYAAGMGTALNQRKRVDHLGLILADTHAQGLRYGPDFDNLDDLPKVEDGAAVVADYVWEAYDKDMIEFPGTYDTDSRLCLEAAAPRPCTVLGATIGMQTNG